MTKEDFVGNVTKVFLEDNEGFRKEVRAAYKAAFTLWDKNMDGLLQRSEMSFGFHLVGIQNKIKDFFNTFDKPEGIPAMEYVEACTQFHANKEKSKNDLNTAPIERILDEL